MLSRAEQPTLRPLPLISHFPSGPLAESFDVAMATLLADTIGDHSMENTATYLSLDLSCFFDHDSDGLNLLWPSHVPRFVCVKTLVLRFGFGV